MGYVNFTTYVTMTTPLSAVDCHL